MNGVYETTTTSGTGDLTLVEVTGRPRFSVMGVGAVVSYELENGNNKEWGYATVGSGNTLTGRTPVQTLVSGVVDDTSPAAISISGTTHVYLSPIAGVMAPGMPVVSGSFGRKAVLSPHWSTYQSGWLAVTANRLYVIPFKVDSAYDINGFHIDMNTAGAASTKARIGLYRMKSDGQPGELIVETADVDTSVAAAVLSPSVTQTRIYPGWYYVGLVCSGTPTFQAYPSSAYGMNPMGIENGTVSMLPIVMGYKSIAGWSALPASPTGLNTISPGASAVPTVALKLA